MKKLFMILPLLLVLSTGALWAADVPKTEFFAGFSVLHVSDNGFKETPYGAQLSLAGNVNKMFGVAGDFSGEYKDGVKPIYTYLGGPVFSHRLEKVTASAHALYGGTHADGDNMFTMGYGGALDWNASPKVAVRVIQFDWLPIRNSGGGGWTKNITRYGFGVVFKGGKK